MYKKNNTIKASIIEPVGDHGGMTPYDFNLCQGLVGNNVNMALFTSDVTNPPTEAEFTFRPVYQGIFCASSTWLRALRYLRGTILALASSVVESRRICHFHFFVVGPAELMNVVLSRLFNRRTIITAHDVEAFVASRSAFSYLAYRLAHAVIAHNQVSRDELIERFGVPPSKITIIPHGNYPKCLADHTTKSQARHFLGLPHDVPILLFFGQIKEVKGLDILLRAMPEILAHYPSALLVVAGRPLRSTFNAYLSQIADLGISRHCICRIDYIPDSEVRHYFQASDLVVLPYRRIYQSGVLLMAMSFGKGVVASGIPGMRELLEDGKNGFLFRSEDPEDLAQTVNRVLSDTVLLASVAATGQQLMREAFAWDAIGKATAELYKS